ncbi:two-component sensor histidine kinase [Actinosynnema pretiosum subsp. pretiosum]|uniref:histidine kinase n=1 Tax=Actinosynnema pretiosum subsp. pretiosum TaxID=103721 RepID=A0AA45L3W9_9PSEU|nr:two-component system sensor kinase [Actinosynnema pretiosum subsp. pretiosum]QUF02954.1 two-component sensor histidine kinase [Actinosynnema pretiosum subsp. pretiosum]
MSTLVDRMRPHLPDLPAAWGRFRADLTRRLRALTPLRVGREALGLVVVLALDVWPAVLAGGEPEGGLRTLALAAVYALLYELRLVFPALALLGTALVAFDFQGDHGGSAVVAVVAYAAGRRIDPWYRALAAAVVALVAYVAAWAGSNLALIGSVGVFLGVSVYGLAVALPFLVGRYVAQRGALVDALLEREAGRREERALITRQVRLRERNRIAQDMHDSLGHRLSLISVHAGALAMDPGLGERQREAVGVLRGAALTAMEELRGVIGVLRRDAEPDEDQARRTVDAVDELVDGARQAGMRVALVRGGQPRPLPARVSHAAYRIAQEGLTNASKHAPGAAVQVAVRYDPDALVVEVRNNPAQPRATAGSSGFGLIGLGERVRLAGGLLHVGELVTGGFRIAAVLPYEDTGAPGDEPLDDLAGEPQEDAAARAGKFGRPRQWAGVGSIVLAGLVVVALVAGIAWLGTRPVTRVASDELYASVEVGQSESEAMGVLPLGLDPPIGDLKLGAPPEPAGARCLYFAADVQTYSSHGTRVFRFCFAGGEVVEKNTHLREE